MGKFQDLTGQRFGRLTVIERAENRVQPNGHCCTQWLCKCDCGKEVVVSALNLKRGHTRSCGCLVKSHGVRYTRIYNVWCKIKSRCYNPKDIVFKHYGGRGIVMCEEWKNNPKAFFEWAIANGYDKNAKRGECTIDRIDVNGNYEPNNCRWATQKEQCNNKRNNYLITYNNETHTVAEWSRKINMHLNTLYARLYKGWSVEKTLTTPLRGNK